MKRMLLSLIVVLLALTVAGRGNARVEADPNKQYPVTPDLGAWMICASSYTGPEAAMLAHEFVLELRRLDIPAYVFNRGAVEREEQRQRVERMRQLCRDTPGARLPGYRIEDQYAVLVGGYKDIDAAHDALEKLQKKDAPQAWRKWMPVLTVTGKTAKSDKEETYKTYDNPLSHSFVVRNPAAPKDPPPDPNKPDPGLKVFNAEESYSLLKCGHPWTLAVKELRAPEVLTEARAPSESLWGKLGLGNKSADALNATALQAHELARVLRELKFDAYVLHTRYGSVISVGAFDTADDPRLQQLQAQLKNLQFRGAQFPLQLFAQPLPMQVPQL